MWLVYVYVWEVPLQIYRATTFESDSSATSWFSCSAGSSGSVTFTGLPVGDYVIRVIAGDTVSSDRAVIRSGLWILGNNDFCTVTAINHRVTVFGNFAVLEFGNTGSPTGFHCRLDRQQYFPCESNCILVTT